MGRGSCSAKDCPRDALTDRRLCLYHRDKSRQHNAKPHVKALQRDCRLRSMYGITTSDYDAMFAEQGGVCKICGAEAQSPYKHLQVDHHHASGKVRGLLCHRCNKAIGLLGDTPEALQAATDYLREAA